MPSRIQLSRKKGWRMPPNTTKVDRRTPWGNPFRIGHEVDGIVTMSAEHAVRRYEHWLQNAEDGKLIAALGKKVLPGVNLACWCRPDMPCHADVLLRLVNGRSLAACPFCGGQASDAGVVRYQPTHKAWWADGTRITKAFFCSCIRCGITNKGLLGYQTKQIAGERWNTRHSSPS